LFSKSRNLNIFIILSSYNMLSICHTLRVYSHNQVSIQLVTKINFFSANRSACFWKRKHIVCRDLSFDWREECLRIWMYRVRPDKKNTYCINLVWFGPGKNSNFNRWEASCVYILVYNCRVSFKRNGNLKKENYIHILLKMVNSNYDVIVIWWLRCNCERNIIIL